MLFDPNYEQTLAGLQRHLRGCQAITPKLMRDVMARPCLRSQTYPAATKTKIDALIETGAWIDTALALLKLELPQWTLRRLVCDDGEWHCTLSKQPWLPLDLDDSVEAVHAIPALAILCAMV